MDLAEAGARRAMLVTLNQGWRDLVRAAENDAGSSLPAFEPAAAARDHKLHRILGGDEAYRAYREFEERVPGPRDVVQRADGRSYTAVEYE